MHTVPGWNPDPALLVPTVRMTTTSATDSAPSKVMATARETLRVGCVASAVALAELLVFAALAGVLAYVLLP